MTKKKDLDVIEVARSYLNVPYRDQGRSRTGIDCVGLVVMVLADMGFDAQDRLGYTRNSKERELLRALQTRFTRKPDDQIEDGDILFFSKDTSRHIGIASTNRYGQRTIIHAYLTARKVTETELDAIGQRISGVFSWVR